MDPENGDYTPSEWLPIHAWGDIRDELPVSVPEDSWLRTLEEPTRRYPYLHLEVAWVIPPVLHLATIAGFSAGEIPGDDGRDERAVVNHRRISFETITRVEMNLGSSGGGAIELVGGEIIDDGPVALVYERMPKS